MVHAWPIRPRFGLYIYIDVQAEVWRCDSTTLQLWRCDSKTLQLIKYYECHNHPDLWDCNIWQLQLISSSIRYNGLFASYVLEHDHYAVAMVVSKGIIKNEIVL